MLTGGSVHVYAGAEDSVQWEGCGWFEASLLQVKGEGPSCPDVSVVDLLFGPDPLISYDCGSKLPQTMT